MFLFRTEFLPRFIGKASAEALSFVAVVRTCHLFETCAEIVRSGHLMQNLVCVHAFESVFNCKPNTHIVEDIGRDSDLHDPEE